MNGHSTCSRLSDTALLLPGRVMHERLHPTHHRFVYPVFCVRLNLEHLARLNQWWFCVDRPGLMSIRTRDYGAENGTDLLTWIRAQLADAQVPADGEIWLQTFPRIFGYVFNPVSFWYCHDKSGNLRALMADVTNTFGERHRYLLTGTDAQAIISSTILECRKQLHVSPFCRVEGHYQFRVRDTQDTSFVGIDYFDDNGLLLRTSIGGRKLRLTRESALRAVINQPLMTFLVIIRIHWQALRLWLHKVPFFPKPPRTGTPSCTTPEKKP